MHVGSEQVARVMMKNKRRTEWVMAEGDQEQLRQIFFSFIMCLVKNLSAVCHIGIQVLDLSASRRDLPITAVKLMKPALIMEGVTVLKRYLQ